MTVFGVLNFGDQGNTCTVTACVNIYMHVMSKTFLFFICFLPFITIQYMEIFYINGTKYIVVMQSEENNLSSAIF